MNFYEEKEDFYFVMPRHDLISLIPAKPKMKVLELGAGGGYTLSRIIEDNPDYEVHGIELFEITNSQQSNPKIKRMIIGDIEKMELQYDDGYFDVVLIGDVLEHLIDPWNVLRKIKAVMKKGATIICSIPNIRYYQSLVKIFFFGSFKYEKSGIFDKTHMRYFCKSDMIEMFNSVAFDVQKVIPVSDLSDKKSKSHYFNRLTFKLFEEFLNLQYVIIAKV